MHESLDPELRAVEQALAGLVPAAHFDRDRLLFEAGRAAAGRDVALAGRSWRRSAWPLATAALAMIAAALGTALAVRSPRMEIVYLERPAAAGNRTAAAATFPPTAQRTGLPGPRSSGSADLPRESYANLRQRALEGNLDLPQAWWTLESPPPPSPEEPRPYRALRDELLKTAG
jgi:hypothetical protein